MDLKTGLKWVFFLFCVISTLQIVFIIAIIDTLFPITEDPRFFSTQYMIELLIISLASSLPTLVLIHNNKSQTSLLVRHIIHFILTFGIVCGLLIYFERFEVSRWLVLPFVLFFLIYGAAVFFNRKHIQTRMIAKQTAEDRNLLLKHIDEHIRQYTAMRKFKHDQGNILSSMDIFFKDDDWDGAKRYYNDKIKPAFDVITASDFALESLNKIKVQEIKGILTIKLAMAQNLGIDTRFDADEVIDSIPVDSIALVRMLGIILDNAIEELESLGSGTLLVGCFKVEGSVNFVVQNTCRSDMPMLQQLQKPRFTTKGKGRGLGLDNLTELTDSLPNVVLLTGIKDGQFTQKIMIGEDV